MMPETWTSPRIPGLISGAMPCNSDLIQNDVGGLLQLSPRAERCGPSDKLDGSSDYLPHGERRGYVDFAIAMGGIQIPARRPGTVARLLSKASKSCAADPGRRAAISPCSFAGSADRRALPDVFRWLTDL